MDLTVKLALLGLAIGAAFGAVVQRTHFCTMGAISDAWLFGSRRRLRSWLLAIAVSVAGTQALAAAGVVDLASTVYLAPRVSWVGLLGGGVLFGFGMVLAGGCASRNLVRLGAGSLKALVTVLTMGVVGMSALTGVLAPLRLGLSRLGMADVGDLGLERSSLGALAAAAIGVPAWAAEPVLAGLGTAGLLVYCFKDRAFRASPREITAGVVLGAVVVLAWLGVTAGAAGVPEALTFVAPLSQAVLALMLADGHWPFAIGLVAGTVLGASAAALQLGRFRLEGFADRGDLVRHLVGGALMGFGGIAALGCTIGQGLTGLGTMGLGPTLAVGGIVAGAVWALRYLETGHLLAALFPRRPSASSHETML